MVLHQQKAPNARKRAASIFAAGLGFRLLAIAVLSRAHPEMFFWGSDEAGAIARSIVTNHSFASPYHHAHGPTAWLAPGFPAVVAAIFVLFGVQTFVSAAAVMVFNALCSAATGVVVYALGKALHSEPAGWFAGWMWALSPYLVLVPMLLWDSSLSALVLSGILLLMFQLRAEKTSDWALWGTAWGVAAFISPALLAPLPVLAMFQYKNWKRLGLAALCAIALLTPWTVRNYSVFHRIIPIRSNGLSEVYFANAGMASHPLGQSMEYQRLGEADYTSQQNRRTVEYIRENPAAFFRDSAHRAGEFWSSPPSFRPWSIAIDIAALVGLVLAFGVSRQRVLQLFAVLASYPLIYYAVLPIPRYRHPIEPALYALAGVAVSAFAPSKNPAGKWRFPLSKWFLQLNSRCKSLQLNGKLFRILTLTRRKNVKTCAPARPENVSGCGSSSAAPASRKFRQKTKTSSPPQRPAARFASTRSLQVPTAGWKLPRSRQGRSKPEPAAS